MRQKKEEIVIGGFSLLSTSRLFFLMSFFLLIESAFSEDFPFYLRFVPYAPPNLHLRETRASTAYYLPSFNAGVSYDFDSLVLGGQESLAKGSMPVRLIVYRSPANCSGNKSVTVEIYYRKSGVFTLIGSQTQTINVVASGSIMKSFLFSGITSAANHILLTGDLLRIRITANTTRLCLVNEYPIGGTADDSSQVTFRRGPILSMTKISQVLTDPINGVSNAKRIPGSLVRYTLTVSNDGAASAAGDDVTLEDVIPVDMTYASGTMTLDTGGGVSSLTDGSDADEGETDTGTGSGVSSLSVNAGALDPGDSAVVTFDASID